jgi:hypothetical protein
VFTGRGPELKSLAHEAASGSKGRKKGGEGHACIKDTDAVMARHDCNHSDLCTAQYVLSRLAGVLQNWYCVNG